MYGSNVWRQYPEVHYIFIGHIDPEWRYLPHSSHKTSIIQSIQPLFSEFRASYKITVQTKSAKVIRLKMEENNRRRRNSCKYLLKEVVPRFSLYLYKFNEWSYLASGSGIARFFCKSCVVLGRAHPGKSLMNPIGYSERVRTTSAN